VRETLKALSTPKDMKSQEQGFVPTGPSYSPQQTVDDCQPIYEVTSRPPGEPF